MKELALARYPLASLAAFAAMTVGGTSAFAATALKPVLSSAPAILMGSVDLKTLSQSKSNAEALAALAAAKPVAPRARLLPNGRETRLSRPEAASLLRTRANTSVTGGPPAIGGFTGITEGGNAAANGSELEPPDQGLAVDHGIVGEIVNNSIQFFKNGVALTAPLANSTFFGSGTVANLSDPHITFDPSIKRWFVDELTYSGPLGYGFFLAVSKTSDPTAGYSVYFIPSATTDLAGCHGGGGCLPDYPQVGYDANGFYITADLFGNFGFVSAAIYALPKAALAAGTSFTPIRFAVPDFVVQPEVPAPGEPFSFANGGTEYFMTARNIYDGSNTVRVWEVQNTFNIATAPSTLQVPSRSSPASLIPAPCLPPNRTSSGRTGRQQKATSSPQLDGGYNAFGANVKMAHGRLYAALTTGAVDGNGLARDIIAYFVVNVNSFTPKLVSQGYITPPDGYSISYPGIAVDRTGAGYVGFTITNPNKNVAGGFPSTAVVPFSTATGVGSIVVTGQGHASDDGFTGYGAPHSPGQVGRWGDFAAATVDAATGIYYTANEYIPDPNVYLRGTFANWGTFVTAVKK